MPRTETPDHQEPRLARTLGGTLRKLGKYVITGELGRGGHGIVYRGHDPYVQREVAIKVVENPDSAAGAAQQSLFFAEARAAGKLHHPYIVVLYDAGVEENLSYLVMEYVAGETLKRFCAPEGPRLRIERVADIGLKCALALDYIHKAGVLHKDIKPGNIMVTASGAPKIMDFGIAAIAAGTGDVEQALAGSPLYMSPEQLRGEETGPASDLYSLGIVLYLLLCGQPPYDARDTKTLFQQIKRLPPVPLTAQRPDLPEPLCALVMRLLSKNPADRMQNGRELAEALASFTERAEGARRKGLQLSQDSLKQLAFFWAS
jgi:eukaryotic-like serine/threonine-protein kinase